MKESGENIHGYKLREMGETRQKSQQYFFSGLRLCQSGYLSILWVRTTTITALASQQPYFEDSRQAKKELNIIRPATFLAVAGFRSHKILEEVCSSLGKITNGLF